MRFLRKKSTTRYRCRACGNEFERQGDSIAVCNGINVRADEEGRPVDEDGNVLPAPGPVVLVDGEGNPIPLNERGRPIPPHRPVVMEVV